MFLFQYAPQIPNPTAAATRSYEAIKAQWDAAKKFGKVLDPRNWRNKEEIITEGKGKIEIKKKTKEFQAADKIIDSYKPELQLAYSFTGKIELLDKGFVNPNFIGITASRDQVANGDPTVFAKVTEQLLALEKDNGKIRFTPPVDPNADKAGIKPGNLPPAPSLAKISIPPDVAGGRSIELNPETKPVLADLVKSMNQYAASNGLTFTQTLKGTVATITVNGTGSFGAEAKGTFTLDAIKFDSKEEKENKKYMIDVLDAFETIAKKTDPLRK
jgi:hypothetical protein